MFFIDELADLRVYKRPFLLPIDDQNKRESCAALILGPNTYGTIENVLQFSLLQNRYYNSYYVERGVMYYINPDTKDTEVVDESTSTIETTLYSDTTINIIYNGPHGHVSSYINEEVLLELSARYNYKFTSNIPVNISLVRNREIKSNAESINVNTLMNYDKHNFKSYEIYCKTQCILYLINQINPDMNEWFKAAIAFEGSGLFDEYYNSNLTIMYKNWPFNRYLISLCDSLRRYIKKFGWTVYLKKIVHCKDYIREIAKYTSRDILEIIIKVSDIISWYVDDFIGDHDPVVDRFVENGEIPLDDTTTMVLVDEANSMYNPTVKKLIFDDRLKSTKDQKQMYDTVISRNSDIKYTFTNLKLYKKKNIFIDFSMYMAMYVRNSQYKNIKGYNLFMDFMDRLINDKRITENGYTTQTVIIPIFDWVNVATNNYASNDIDNVWIINKSINPISCIYYSLMKNPKKIAELFGNRDVILLGNSSYMKVNFSKIDINKSYGLFLKNIKNILNREPVTDDDYRVGQSSPKAIKLSIIDKIETSQKITINNIVPKTSAVATVKTLAKSSSTKKEEEIEKIEKEKEELVEKIDKATKTQSDEKSALDTLDKDDEIKQLLADLASNPDNGGNNISGARASRLLKLEDDFLDSEYKGKTMKEIIETPADAEPVKPMKLDIDSVNPEWEKLNYISAIQSYDLDSDIRKIFHCFANKTHKFVPMSIEMQDNSTSEDLIDTYTCKYESDTGARYTIIVDIPRVIDGQYTKLRGNRKNIPGQLFWMPIGKTEEDTVQTVSCYNKIFIRRFGTTTGKSNVYADKLIKTIFKHGESLTGLSYVEGDNSRVCSKYEVPLDYIDIASAFSQIKTKSYTFIFNQDILRSKYNVDDKKGFCVGIDNKTREPVYLSLSNSTFVSSLIASMIMIDVPEFEELYNSVSESVRYCYSRASIMSTDIPLIVVCAHSVGLEPVMKQAGINYNITEKRPKKRFGYDIIKFNDAFLEYELTYSSSLLMNGLKACDTENHSILEINSKPMYLDFLDMFGGRVKSDGLDNFYDCYVDPITKEVLEHYKLPTDYIGILLHANLLLADNKYTKHGDIRSTRRLRRMEQIAHILYEVLAKAYGTYNSAVKHGSKATFSIKQTAVIDSFLLNNTTEDKSILNVLGEYEGVNAVTPRGPSGMNNDRSYSLDKRSFDDSMVDVLSAATGFAGNVGITRQATIDANIQGTRGYIYNDPDIDNLEINSIKTLCMTESLTPFGPTRDDPMRQAMGFVQTSKHGMRSKISDPLLITTGADEALPYMTSNIFSYKSKKAGTVIEVTDEYMIIEYDAKGDEKAEREYIDLSTKVEKNSSSGFYINLKLSTDLKVGKKFKANEILAYDKESFSADVGATSNIAYNIGTLAKMAILNTDDGFEDSAIVSNDLSEGLASDVVVLPKTYTIPKDANIYNMVSKGSKIQEGETLFILQNSYDDSDTNTLLANLAADSEEEITNLGRIPITSKVTGIVQDIVITRTVELSELSPTLKKLVTTYENDVKRRKKVFKENGIEDTNHILPDTDVLPAIGKLKNAADCVVIEIYLSYFDKFKPGDKMIYGTAVKGVDQDIFPIGDEPRSKYRPDEKIHSLLSIGSINARMVTSVLITGGINKGLIELSRKIKDYLDIPYDINLLGDDDIE